MIKAVLFDLDNILIDFMSLKRVAGAKAADAMVKDGLRAKQKHLNI